MLAVLCALVLLNLLATVGLYMDRPTIVQKPEREVEADYEDESEPEWKRARRAHGWNDEDFWGPGASA